MLQRSRPEQAGNFNEVIYAQSRPPPKEVPIAGGERLIVSVSEEEGLHVAQYYCVLDEVPFRSLVQFSRIIPIIMTRRSDIYAGGKFALNVDLTVFAVNDGKIGRGNFNFDIGDGLAVLIHKDQTERRMRTRPGYA